MSTVVKYVVTSLEGAMVAGESSIKSIKVNSSGNKSITFNNGVTATRMNNIPVSSSFATKFVVTGPSKQVRTFINVAKAFA